MNRINRKLLLKSLAVLAVLGLGLFLVNRYQVSRYGDFYFAEARVARKSGNFPKAVAHYREAIRLGKQDFDAYSELADTLFKMDNYENSWNFALWAEQIERGHEANQRILAETALRLRKPNDVLQWTNKLLAKSPGDPELLILRGKAKTLADDFVSAAEEYEQALKSPNASVSAYVDLATIYADSLKSFDKGREVIDRLRVGPEITIEQLVEHGSWYVRYYARRSISSREDELDSVKELLAIARKDAQEGLAKYPDEPSPFILAMQVANIDGRFDETLRLAERAIPMFPAELALYALAATAASETQQLEIAGQYLQNGLRQFPNDLSLLWGLANLQLETKDLESGRATLKKLEAADKPRPQTRFLNARFLTAEGKFQEAIKEYEGTRSEMTDDPVAQKIVDLELARCYEGIGDRPGQIQVLRRATWQNSGWLAAREQLAIALLAAGRIDEATEEYAGIARTKQAPVGAELNLARLLVIQNISREASRRNWKQVDEILREIEKAVGLQNDVAIVQAESLLAQGRIKEAKEILEKLQPSDATFAARILLEVNQRSWSEADRLFTDSQSRGFDSIELRRARAIRAVLGEVPEKREILNDLAKFPETWSPEQGLELQKELLPIVASAGIEEMVQNLADAILAKDPTNLTSRFEILELQRRNKDRAGMQRTLSEVKRISGENAIWSYGQAIALVVDPDKATPADFERAQQYLNEASIKRPDWADVPALSGDLYYKMNNAEAAIPKYEQAIKLGWKRLETAERLLKLLIERGRFTEADDMIRRLSQSSPALSSQMSRAASEISWKLDNLTRAVEKAEEAAKLSQSPDDFLWLSQIKLISKDREGAEAALNKAREIAPTSPKILVAWTDFLRESARLEEARRAASQLESQIDPSDALQVLTLAEIFNKLDMSEQSSQMVSKIDPAKLQTVTDHDRYYRLKSALSPERRAEYLKGVVALEGRNENPSTLMWARRQLALLALNQQDYEAARELLEFNMKTASKSTIEGSARFEDRRLLAWVSALEQQNKDPTNPQQEFRDPAIPLQQFDALLNDKWTPNADDLFLVGKLCIANNDWTRGSRYFMQLLNRSEGRDPSHIKYYVSKLLNRHDSYEAKLWLDVLRRDGVQDIETAELLAEIRYQRGQFEELLRDLVGGEESKYPDTEWFQATVPLRRRFEMLNVFLTEFQSSGNAAMAQQFAEASEKMAATLESASDFPGAFYATQLLARGEVAKSITALERVAESTSTDELDAFVGNILIADVSPEQLERLDQVLSKLNRPDEESVFGVFSARLKEQRGDFTGAEKIYRGILESNPRNGVVLNNLANLLALRGQNPKEAMNMINESIAIEGETAMFLDTRGVVHLKAGNFKEAVKDLEEAVRLYPHPLLRYHLAWAMYKSSQSAEAKLELINALNSGLQKSMTHVLERPIYDTLMKELMSEDALLPNGGQSQQ